MLEMHPVALIAVIKGNETSKMLNPYLTTTSNEGIIVTDNERASMVEYKNRDKYKPRRTPRSDLPSRQLHRTGLFLSFFYNNAPHRTPYSPHHIYRRAKQHIIPVLPRNQQAPTKRKSATTAFDHSKAWKKRDVRSVEEF